MWVIALFDLPTDTAEARRDYREFREVLLSGGFIRLQFSVYARHCPSEENAQVHQSRLKNYLPPDGEVRILTLTDKQFDRMQIFYGKTRGKTEKGPTQLSFL